MRLPNIVYIHSHDTGRYIQPYGHAVPTPNLQRLAEGGVVFRNHHTAGPTCSPSRAALFTGQRPHQCGMLGLAHRGFRLNDYSKCLPHILRRGGYVSHLLGIQHIAHSKEDVAAIGYDVVDVGSSTAVAAVAPKAASYLKQGLKSPFFLDVGFFETHRKGRDFQREDYKTDPRYVRPPAPLPDTTEIRADMAKFIDSARTYDAGVGMVLDALDEAGLSENTIVVATTDHGIAFPGMKSNLTSHGTGIMLVMRGPGIPRGLVSDALSSNVDVLPTLCEMAGVGKPAWLEGRSLLPALKDGSCEVNDEIFSEVTYHAAFEPMRSVRTKKHLYIRRFKERAKPVLPNCDASPSKDLWMERGWPPRTVEMEQLYDLTFDPNEAENVASRPDMREVLEDMRGRLRRFMERTGDPLLKGVVPLPPGIISDDEDSINPDAGSARRIS